MTTPHPEPEQLAELLDPPGDAVEPTVRAEVEEHVASCAQCGADLDAQRSVHALLAALPGVPMPPDVVARIEEALRAVPDATPGRAPGAAPETSATVTVLPPPRRSVATGGRAWRVPPAAAASIVGVLAVGALVGLGFALHGSSGSKSSASSAASAAPSAAPVILSSGTAYTPATIRAQVSGLLATNVPDALGAYGLAAGGFVRSAPAAAASAPAASSAAAAQAPMATAASTAASGNPVPLAAPATSGPPGGPLAQPSALQACLDELAGKPGATALLVDHASWQGKPATIIVLPDPSTPDTLDVFVEDDDVDCAGGSVSYVTFLTASASPTP